ncbi:MAG: c-type cytochrome [Planctomycetota bacterium]|nr:c-type cytochrome [Planctomycetota bacterium]
MPATEKFSRNLKTLHVVFAASCLALLVATVWMMAADHSDEWRDYQKKNFLLLEKARARKLTLAENALDPRKREDVQKDLKEAEDKLVEVQAKLEELDSEITTIAQQEDLKKREQRELNALTGVAKANYDLGIRDNLPPAEMAVLFEKFQEKQSAVNTVTKELQEATTRLAAKRREAGEVTKTRDHWKVEQLGTQRELDLLEAAVTSIAPTGFLDRTKRTIMEWPIIDGFNSHLKIQQDWLPKLRIKLGMSETARFDRCRTCHLNIDTTETGGVPAFPFGHPGSDDVDVWLAKNEFPQPFATHPHPELYSTASSPHPVEKFGCTICHDGNGSGTSVQNAEHSPNDPHMGEEWTEHYAWKSNHFWEYPMQPSRFVESSCIKCHHNVTELGVNKKHGATAPKVHKGFQLIQKYGCFGCHEIHGYDAGKPIGPDIRLEPQTEAQAKAVAEDKNQVAGQMRKVGPALTSIAQKSTKAFIQHWTELPKRFRPSTRMPQFFGLTNQQDFYAKSVQPAEIAAISQYLVSKSRDIELHKPAAEYKPSRDAGKKAFMEQGCMNCHQHKAIDTFKPDFGPDLSRIHEKIRREPAADGDPPFSNWLYTWIRDPERHHPRTKMPDFFLDPFKDPTGNVIDPAADIVAFLLSQGEPGNFQEIEAAPYLGAELDDEFTQEEAVALRLESARGVRVISVIPISPAARAGLAPNDIILKIDDAAVNNKAAVDSFLESSEVGATVAIEILRGDARQTIEVSLDDSLNDLTRLFLSKTLTRDDIQSTLSKSSYTLNGAGIKGDEIELAYVATVHGSKLSGSVKSVQDATELNQAQLEFDVSQSAPMKAGDLIYWNFGRNFGRTSTVKAIDSSTRVAILTEDLPKPIRVGDEFYVQPQTLRVSFDQANPVLGENPQWVWQTGANQNSVLQVDSIKVDGNEWVLTIKSRFPSRTPVAGDQLVISGVITEEMKQNYVGRRTISRYGCYACHTIPGFEEARPIGTTLQDWARKDTSKLALEHIAEYLHHHGEESHSHHSTKERAERAIAKAQAGGLDKGEFASKEEEDRELSVAFFYENLLHHGRPGFIWQKLRQPRSYDFKKIETKGYDERLRMPKFPLTDEEIEAISTFVLGLVAEPPAAEYLYRPTGAAHDRIQGEQVLDKFNCTGCHMVDLPVVRFAQGDLSQLNLSQLRDADHPEALEMMLKLRPPQNAHTGQRHLSIFAFEKWLRKYKDTENHSDEMKSQLRKLRANGITPRKLAEAVEIFGSRDLESLIDDMGEDSRAKESYRKIQSFVSTHGPAMRDVIGTQVIEFRGLLNSAANPEDPEYDQFNSYQLWDTLELDVPQANGKPVKRQMWPSSTIGFAPSEFVSEQPARGGKYADWLTRHLKEETSAPNLGFVWQRVPPPLYQEGFKVQTNWLYRFLKNPYRLRHFTVLRMPRFNLSDGEAKILANYFAAYDDTSYPYQNVPQRELPYLQKQNLELAGHLSSNGKYLSDSWKVLNSKTCVGCHTVGGRVYQKSSDPKQVQGPDLQHVASRLRPEWTQLWLYKPQWITPYTSMLAPFAKNQPGYKSVLNGDPKLQTIALRDALMNYDRLLEQDGKTPQLLPLDASVEKPKN